MGTSNWQNISYCIDLIRQIKPSSILDIGIGYGRWGMIGREFLDVWDGRVFREDWITRIDGIEVFPKNIDAYHSYFYDNIYIGDAYNILDDVEEKYELIILGDVLEHFEKDKATILLNKCLSIGSYVMLNIPIGENWEQGALYENDYEEHLSFWVEEELDKFPVIRKRFFKDYIGRDFSTYLFSNLSSLESKMKKSEKIDVEIERLKFDSKLLIDDVQRYTQLSIDMKTSLKQEILLEEKKILSYRNPDQITIEVTGEKNPLSNGTEVWIYNIGSEIIKSKDLNKIEKEGFWDSRRDEFSLTGDILLSWEADSRLKFPLIGEELKLTCLTHPWSGRLKVCKNGYLIRELDLYAEESEIQDFIIDLRDE